MASEALTGGDLEYVEQAGEAHLLIGWAAELKTLKHTRCQLS
jgi:hypothetical protein